MSRYLSDAQRRDLKLRVSLGVLVLTLGSAVWAVGPGLERVLDHAREHQTEHWAPKRYYDVAQVMEWTFRGERAQQVYEEFYLLYCGSEILEEEDLFSEISDDPEAWCFLPWVEQRYDEESSPRPKPLSRQRDPLLGRVLVAVGTYYEGERLYLRSEHIFACLRIHWEPGTLEYTEGQDAYRRSMLRSF